MPAVAKKDGSSSVTCSDGSQGGVCATKPTRYNWNAESTQSSDVGSADVFVENIGVVRDGDAMISHPDGDPCVQSPSNHSPTLSTFSPNVFANNKQIARIGDKYNNGTAFDHTISTGASTVFAN